MERSRTDETVADLLDNLGSSFLLDKPIGGRTLGELLLDVISDARAERSVTFGTPGDEAELRRSSDGVMNFLYRPHLFPGMDPALHLGHLVQYNLLPRELPPGSPIEACAMLESYCHLSGDLLGWQSVGDGDLTVWLLDVSGHGVRAGFAAVVIKLILADSDPELSLVALAKEVERRFLELRNPADPGCLYATGAFLRIGDQTAVDYLSAGHPPLLLRRRTGPVERLEATMVPLALFPDAGAASSTFDLEDGDTLLVCSDGLLELRNADDEFFDVDRVAGVVVDADGDPSNVMSRLSRAVAEFHDLSRLDDDLSVLILRRAGP